VSLLWYASRIVGFGAVAGPLFVGAWGLIRAGCNSWSRACALRHEAVLKQLSNSDLERQPSPKPRWGEVRWPGPGRHEEELAGRVRCDAYARLAQVVGETKALNGELTALVGGAALGATLPNYARSSVWAYACYAALFLAAFGLRGRWRAAGWKQRAAYYRGLARSGGLKQDAEAVGDASSSGAVASGAHPLGMP